MLIENNLPKFNLQNGGPPASQRLCEIMVAGATIGRSYSLKGLCWIVQREWGINAAGSSGSALDRLAASGFVVERQYDTEAFGTAARPVTYIITSVKGTSPTEFDTRLPIYDDDDIPEDYSPSSVTTKKSREKKKTEAEAQGVAVPPLGATLQITEAHMNGAGIVVTLDRKWKGHVDQEAMIVGSEVQVLGAGFGKDGVWVQTNDFTMTMKGK